MSACDGNCAVCPFQCAGKKIQEKLEEITHKRKEKPTQQEETMATVTSTSGCGAPKDIDNVKAAADIQRLSEENERLKQEIARLGSSTPLSTGIKTMVYAIGFVAFVALIMAAYALAQTAKYAEAISAANITAAESQKIANEAMRKAGNAEERAEKNFVYLRDMKRDLKQK